MIADNQRNKRVRLLIKKLNKERKRQAQKIDILCNDLVAAQRNFIKKLNVISFTATFYESIMGLTDLEDLMYTAARMMKAETADANITFFLRHEKEFSTELKLGSLPGGVSTNFELYMFESHHPITFETVHTFDDARGTFENCFSHELMDNICKSNKVCTLDDMFAMGLQGNLMALNKVSAATFPLGLLGSLLGFMLIYRSSKNPLTDDEIEKVRAVTGGLSRAIASCQILSRERPSEQSRATD